MGIFKKSKAVKEWPPYKKKVTAMPGNKAIDLMFEAMDDLMEEALETVTKDDSDLNYCYSKLSLDEKDEVYTKANLINELEDDPVSKAATVYIHTFDGKTTPVILKPGVTLQIKTKDGYVCAMVSVDVNPPSEEKVEAVSDGKRIVEV